MSTKTKVTMVTKFGDNDENTVGIDGDIYRKLIKKGYTHDHYNDLARLPTKTGSESYLLFNDKLLDTLLPGFELIGSGSQNYVFLNHNTKKVNKYPRTTLTLLSTDHQEIQYTPLDILIRSIGKAVETNAAAVILPSKKLHSYAEPNGVIVEDYVDTNRPATHKDLGWKAGKYFHIDPFRIKGNYFWQKDGSIAVVDGLTLMVSKASREKQKEFFEKVLVQETDKILGRFPEFIRK
jgi:hypothetical protein